MDFGFTTAAYVVAAVLFILSLGGLSGQESAKRAVWYGMAGMALAVICAEDQNFDHHWGFDLEAIQESIEEYKKGKRLRGASTISQQTAKNVFLYPSRSWLRKGLEVYFTTLIELIWTKDRILTVYLNSIEFGTGIYGVEAASNYFYGRSADQLSRSQSALLAAVLPNPHRFLVNRPSSYILGRQQWILKQMSQHNYILPRKKMHEEK